MSDSWFWLRSWSHRSWDWTPHQASGSVWRLLGILSLCSPYPLKVNQWIFKGIDLQLVDKFWRAWFLKRNFLDVTPFLKNSLSITCMPNFHSSVSNNLFLMTLFYLTEIFRIFLTWILHRMEIVFFFFSLPFISRLISVSLTFLQSTLQFMSILNKMIFFFSDTLHYTIYLMKNWFVLFSFFFNKNIKRLDVRLQLEET